MPNSHYREEFDYSYTGMSIYNIEGKIIIDDIVPGSPAFKAGFQKDDVIMSVNKNFSNDINQYKNILQSTREHVRVIISRNNSLFMKNLKVGKIF